MKKSLENNNHQLCTVHSLPLQYFCKACQKWICSDCGMIDSSHKSHRIITKKQIFSESQDQIREELSQMEQKIAKIKIKKEECFINLQFYTNELKWCKNQIMEYVKNLLSQAEAQTNIQVVQIQIKIKQYQQKLKALQKHKKYLQNVLSSGEGAIKMNNSKFFSQSSILNVSQDQEMQSIFIEKDHKLSIMDQFFPQFTTFNYEFNYENFKHDLYHYSDYLQLWGQDWRIKIYPKGNSTAEGKFLSVFLELTNGHLLQKARKYFYRIELLNLNKAGQTIIKEYSSIFESGECWGYSQFMKLERIEEYLFQGRLFFSIGVRNQSYAGFSNDLKKYIIKIEKENKILEKLVCESNYEKQRANEAKQEK